jgi:hypothetical protein
MRSSRAIEKRPCPGRPAPRENAPPCPRCRQINPRVSPPCRRGECVRPSRREWCDCKSPERPVQRDGKAQLPQGFRHDLRVLAPQGAAQGDGSSASAARIRARLVMLLEPGTVMSADTGQSNGTISMTSGSGMRWPAFIPATRLRWRANGPAAAWLWQKFLDGFDILAFQRKLKFLQILDEHAQHPAQILAVGQRDVAPHLRRTGSDARGVAKTVGANQRLLLGMHRAEHIIGQFRRDHMRQMAGAADQSSCASGVKRNGSLRSTSKNPPPWPQPPAANNVPE